MKNVLRTLGFLLVCNLSHAADLTLTDGRTFRDATIVSQSPRTVVLKHADGLSGISKTLLPADLSARYPIDEAAAIEADQRAIEARARAQEFHKAEAERAALVRIEREQSALRNAQIAAEEAAARLAEAEAARIARERTEVVYDYISFHGSPRYFYTPLNPRDCEPRWNDKRRDNHFIHDNHAHRNDRDSVHYPHASHTHAQNPRGPRSHNSPPTPWASQAQSEKISPTVPKAKAAALIRR